MRRIRVAQAAKIIGVSAQTIRRWGERGILKPAFIGPGGHRFYNEEDVRELAKLERISDPNDREGKSGTLFDASMT